MLTIDKPQHQIISEDNFEIDNLNLGRIVPVYPLVENLNIKALRKAISNAIDEYSASIENLIPDSIINKYELLDRKDAIKIIHFPQNNEMLEKAEQKVKILTQSADGTVSDRPFIQDEN